MSSVRKESGLPLLAFTPFGFAFRSYSGPGNGWFNNCGAGLPYEIFWILVAFLFFPLKALRKSHSWMGVHHQLTGCDVSCADFLNLVYNSGLP